MVVLVTGSNGQLGQSLQFISANYPEMNFVFCSSSELDITNLENCKSIFKKYNPTFCVNTAAYTAVDKAETEKEKAYLINVLGAKNIAEVCKENNTILLHISTDFVFEGTNNVTSSGVEMPYLETDKPNPSSVYGKTKLEGEIAIQKTWYKHFIIRTSWVYSQFGNNFMKTMLRLGSERESLAVVNDQIGTPTNAVDLAKTILKIIKDCHSELVYFVSSQKLGSESHFGVYNFSNVGQCSWYDFANEIFKQSKTVIDLKPISTEAYPTLAKRPKYSVLDKSKIKETFGISILDWKTSLYNLLQKQ